MTVDDEKAFGGICEVCLRPFTDEDLEDGFTLTADCCERPGLCSRCREPGEHDCDLDEVHLARSGR